MATYTYKIDPGNSSGTDYTSLSAWEAAVEQLHVSGDTVIAECYRTTSAKDTTAVVIHNWDAGVIIKIVAHPDHLHEGKYADTRSSDGNYIAILSVNGSCLYNYLGTSTALSVEGMILDGTSGSTSYCAYFFGSVINCICKAAHTGLQLRPDAIVRNTVVYGGSSRGIWSGVATGIILENVTVHGFYYGIDSASASGGFLTTNCFAGGSSNNDFNGTFNSSSDYNVSSDTTAEGTNNAQSKTAYGSYFEDYSNGDFHLTDTGLNLWGLAGDDLSGTFTEDIDSETRSNWDIGADEFVASGSIVPLIMQQM